MSHVRGEAIIQCQGNTILGTRPEVVYQFYFQMYQASELWTAIVLADCHIMVQSSNNDILLKAQKAGQHQQRANRPCSSAPLYILCYELRSHLALLKTDEDR